MFFARLQKGKEGRGLVFLLIINYFVFSYPNTEFRKKQDRSYSELIKNTKEPNKKKTIFFIESAMILIMNNMSITIDMFLRVH